MNSPRAAAIPARKAAPYPRCVTLTTRAPCSSEIRVDPSVEPLSATITSPRRPDDSNARLALSIQKLTEFASLRHGITTETSTVAIFASDIVAGASLRAVGHTGRGSFGHLTTPGA